MPAPARASSTSRWWAKVSVGSSAQPPRTALPSDRHAVVEAVEAVRRHADRLEAIPQDPRMLRLSAHG